MTTQQLMAEIDKLPIQEQVDLADGIWEQIEKRTGRVVVSAEFSAELDRRYEEFTANPGVGVSWEVLRSRLNRYLLDRNEK